jgi:hypothetical protein
MTGPDAQVRLLNDSDVDAPLLLSRRTTNTIANMSAAMKSTARIANTFHTSKFIADHAIETRTTLG